VHPASNEAWGLVVNEAMASGLPVLVSRRCGCAYDLVKEGVNGFTFDPTDEAELSRQLCDMTTMPQERRCAMSAASRRIVADFGVERFAEGLLEAFGCAAQTSRS
jgi:glycosyltransferase involved in cell wall biosynthesis